MTIIPLEYVNDASQWHHNGLHGVSNHQPHHCLLNRLFRHRWKNTSKIHVTGLCEGNSPVTGEFPAQMASNADMCVHLMTSSWSNVFQINHVKHMNKIWVYYRNISTYINMLAIFQRYEYNLMTSSWSNVFQINHVKHMNKIWVYYRNISTYINMLAIFQRYEYNEYYANTKNFAIIWSYINQFARMLLCQIYHLLQIQQAA